jgi:hypothetical protein
MMMRFAIRLGSPRWRSPLVLALPPAPPTGRSVADAKAFKKFFTKNSDTEAGDFVNDPIRWTRVHKQWVEKEQFRRTNSRSSWARELFTKPFERQSL